MNGNEVSVCDLHILYKSGYLIEKEYPLPSGGRFIMYGENPDKPYPGGVFDQFFEILKNHDVTYICSSGQENENNREG